MKAIFVDTSYWVAILNEKDDLHTRALVATKKLGSVRLLTSEMVLTEVLNEFSKYGKHFRKLAASLIHKIKSRTDVGIIPQGSAQFDEALSVYEIFLDKQWSHTDCASYSIMQKEKITEALSHDHHFKQMGVTALLK